MTKEEQLAFLSAFAEEDYARGYQQGRADERKAHEETFEWCHDCLEYDKDNNCCRRWSKVIRDTVAENYQSGREDAAEYILSLMFNLECGTYDHDEMWKMLKSKLEQIVGKLSR